MNKLLQVFALVAICASVVLAAFLVSHSLREASQSIARGSSETVANLEDYWEDPLLAERVIVLTEGIDPELAKKTISQLLYLEEAGRGEPISLLLKTTGGNSSDCMAIMDAMKLISSPVNVTAAGQTSSCGAFILAAATGDRVAMSGSIIGIHMVFRQFDPEERFSRNALLSEYIRDFWAEHATLPESFFPETGHSLNKTFYLSATEALDYGLVDRIFESTGHSPTADIRPAH